MKISLVLYLATSFFWVINHHPALDFLLPLPAILIGSLLLEVDHLIYWFFTHPQLEESRLAQITWKKGDWPSLLRLYQATRHRHTDLIFHHFLFQTILSAVSLFVFSSTSSIFGRFLLLSLNIHLIIHEIHDYRTDPDRLQRWLFARSSKQLPLHLLPTYLYIFSFFCAIFTILLIFS